MNVQEISEIIKMPPFKKEHYEIELSDVTIVQPDVVEIDHEKLSMTERGVKSLCGLLEVPSKFYNQLHADEQELWNQMVKRLEEIRTTRVRYSVGEEKDKKFIHAFNPAASPWIPNEEFLKIIQWVLDETKEPKMELKTIYLWREGLGAQFRMLGKDAPIVEGGTDIFNMGLDICNSEILDFRSSVEFALERMVCTNRATITEKGNRWAAVHRGSSDNLILNFYEGINNLISRNISVEKFIRERVGKMLNVKASVRELEAAYKLGESCADRIPDRLADFDEKVPIKYVADKYGLEFPIGNQRSERWKMTAITPIDLYDLYNNITFVASNSKELSDEEKFRMQIAIGNVFLSKTPDLREMAPTIVWN